MPVRDPPPVGNFGLGSRISETIGEALRKSNPPVALHSTTAHPRLGPSRNWSPMWEKLAVRIRSENMFGKAAAKRDVWSHKYVGHREEEEMEALLANFSSGSESGDFGSASGKRGAEEFQPASGSGVPGSGADAIATVKKPRVLEQTNPDQRHGILSGLGFVTEGIRKPTDLQRRNSV